MEGKKSTDEEKAVSYEEAKDTNELKFEIASKVREKAVKDTAKEILQEAENLLHECAMEYANAGHKDYFGVCEIISHKVIRKIAKEKGVEVE